MFQYLQHLIITYDRIFLLSGNILQIENLLSDYDHFKQSKKILWVTAECNSQVPLNLDFVHMDKEILIEWRHLYHTYEFSDKFRILSMASNFGTIWNYVKTGLLSPEEAISALLY